jgi:hypothetical protein
LKIDAAPTVDVVSRWRFRDNRPIELRLSQTAVTKATIGGPGQGTSGLLVAIVNPTPKEAMYRLTRSIGGRVIDDDVTAVDSGSQLVRVYRSSTGEPIQLDLSGGPMVYRMIRWDPLVRHIETGAVSGTR